MFKAFISIPALFLSVGALAASPDFSVLAQKQSLEAPGHGPDNKMHECAKNAWQATNPSEDQNHQACDFMHAAKAVMDEHKDAIHDGMHNLFAAWSQHPISKDAVKSAEMALHDHIVPVKEAIEDAQINTLNLLSNEQRSTFDHTFFECLHN